MKSFGIKIASLVFALSLAPSLGAEPQAYHPYPGYPGRYPIWECASQSVYGQRFYARDEVRHWAQRRAQDKCLYRARACRPIGCRAY